MTTTQTFNAAALQKGDRVIATYNGNTVEGTVRQTRRHTLNYRALEVWIEFEPTLITVADHYEERTSLLLYVHSDGSNCDSYNRWGNHSVRPA